MRNGLGAPRNDAGVEMLDLHTTVAASERLVTVGIATLSSRHSAELLAVGALAWWLNEVHLDEAIEEK